MRTCKNINQNLLLVGFVTFLCVDNVLYFFYRRLESRSRILICWKALGSVRRKVNKTFGFNTKVSALGKERLDLCWLIFN